MGTQLYTPNPKSIIHNTKVDFTNRAILKNTINLVQYDRGIPIIAVSLYKNGRIYSLPTGMTVKIKWGKRDKTFVYKDALGCNTERNIIFFDVDEQMTYFHGKLDPIIELVDSSGSTPTMAGSSSIPVVIEKNPIQETDIESSNEYVDLVQAVSDAQQAAQDAEEIVGGLADNYFNKTEIDSMLEDKVDKDDQLIIGDLATQAGRGDFVKIAYDHSQETHAPSNAQKNSDITKVEIEAKLTGQITSHNHDTVYYKKSEVYSKTEIDQSINDYEPDGVTIVFNEDDKLKVSKKLEIDGGFL